MIVRRFSGPGVLIWVLLLGSCAPRPEVLTLDTGAVEPSALIRMVHARAALLKTLEGRGTVSFDSPDFGGTAAFELSLRKPDSLLVLLEGPFGIDIGSLFLSGDQYVAYNASENVVVKGASRSSTLRAIIPFDLSFPEVIDAFSGSLRPPSGDDPVELYTIDDGRFLLRMRCGSQICSYWIDNVFVRVTRLEIRDGSGEMLLQAEASSFTGERDLVVPKRMSVWFPAERKQITVVYSSIAINEPEPSFTYSLPKDARVISR